MSIHNGSDLVIVLTSPDQLFNAPPVNPFSEKDVDVLGESGLTLIVRQMQAHRRDGKYTRLIIRLPPEGITPGLEQQVADALHRYCKAKIEANSVAMRLMRVRSGVWLAILGAIVIAIVAAAYVVFTTVFSDTPQPAIYLVAGIISLFSWVTLWDVLEALIFNPLPMQRENSDLRAIIDLDVVIVSDTAVIEQADSRRTA